MADMDVILGNSGFEFLERCLLGFQEAEVSFRIALACLSSTCSRISSLARLSFIFHSFHASDCGFLGARQAPILTSNESSESSISSVRGFQSLLRAVGALISCKDAGRVEEQKCMEVEDSCKYIEYE